MFCKNCGKKTEVGNKLCSECRPMNNNEDKERKGLLQILFGGRIGRLHYFLGTLIILGIGTLVVMIYPNELLSFVFSILTLPLAVRRLHDVDLPEYLAPIGWLSFLGGIGILVAVIFNLFLLFKKGNAEANKYGFPVRNNKGILWVGGVALALFILSIIMFLIAPLIF